MVTLIIIIAIAVLLILVVMFFAYNNREIRLRKEAEAQEKNIEAVFDEVWKVINQKAQVSEKYKESFREIYREIMAARYGTQPGQQNDRLMNWIRESNPQFDAAVYLDLSASIESLRAKFANEQARMLDIIREHETLCQTYPATWFIKDKRTIEYQVISSAKTREVIDSRTEDNVNVF